MPSPELLVPVLEAGEELVTAAGKLLQDTSYAQFAARAKSAMTMADSLALAPKGSALDDLLETIERVREKFPLTWKETSGQGALYRPTEGRLNFARNLAEYHLLGTASKLAPDVKLPGLDAAAAAAAREMSPTTAEVIHGIREAAPGAPSPDTVDNVQALLRYRHTGPAHSYWAIQNAVDHIPMLDNLGSGAKARAQFPLPGPDTNPVTAVRELVQRVAGLKDNYRYCSIRRFASSSEWSWWAKH